MANKTGAIIKNTIKTTKDVASAYGNVTDGGGAIISSFWNMGMGLISLVSKIIKFILTQLAKIPNMIAQMFRLIENIPTEIKNKIRGNIKLYVTADSIIMFYNNIFPNISRFLSLSKDLSDGDTWTTFFNVIKGNNIKEDIKRLLFTKKDTTICKDMKKTVSRLYNFDIVPTTIEMTNIDIVNIYFGTNEVIEFTDLHGTHHRSSYFDALAQLMKDLNNGKVIIERLYRDLGVKYKNAEIKQALSKIDINTQEKIGETIQYVSVVVNIIGKMLSCVIKDMNTIKGSYNSINKKMNVKNSKIEDSKKIKK